MKETSSPGSPALWAGSFTLPIFHGSFLMTPGFFPLKTKKYLHRHPADSWLKYIYFMKIGQPKLSERKSQPFDSLACPSSSLRPVGSGLTLSGASLLNLERWGLPSTRAQAEGAPPNGSKKQPVCSTYLRVGQVGRTDDLQLPVNPDLLYYEYILI